MDGFNPAPVAHPTDEMEVATTAQMRNPSVVSEKAPIQERVWGFAARTDPTVTFEEFTYWAKIEREMEVEEEKEYRATQGSSTLRNWFKAKTSKEGRAALKADKEKRAMQLQSVVEAKITPKDDGMLADEKTAAGEVASTGSGDPPTYDDMRSQLKSEFRVATRAMRTASWGQMFFLITTDILGWSSAPYTFASVGYGAGVALYVIFGIFASFSGWAIWRIYLDLDSSRYPMQSFGDPFLRLFGPRSRHFINVAQALQQFFTVSVLIISKSQSLEQLSGSSICFIGAMLICMGIGMASGIIRSLRKIGWISNLSVWLNITNFIIIMVAAAAFKPYYPAVIKQTLIKTIEPAKTFAGTPPQQYQQQSLGFSSQFNAVDSMVYSYAGALLFVAFLAEMRHPLDFWKGLFMAQAFICIVYLLFGVFVYSFYGQYAISSIVNVIQPFGLQTAGNVLSMLTGFIAVFMYFNIGMKTVYLEVFQEVFNFPPISTKRGRIMWYILGPIYWALAWLIAAAIPNLNGIVNVVGGVFMMNFTYSFPGMMYLGWTIQKAAALPGEGFNPATRVTTRHDNGWKRWIRGYKKTWKISTPTFLYILAGLACSGMGTWAAIEGLIIQFSGAGTVATSFGCAVPV